MKKVLISLFIIGSMFVAMGSTGLASLNIMEAPYFAKADGTDDAPAFIAAINDASITGRPIFIPSGTYGISSVLLKSNVSFIGESNGSTIIKSLNTGEGGVFSNTGDEWADLDNISFNSIKFDGNRKEERSIIFIRMYIGGSINGLTIDNCTFENVMRNGIRIIHATYLDKEPTKSGSINVLNSKFLGGDKNYTSSDCPGSAVRIEYDAGMTYGKYFISNINIKDCYAENMRTLADIKRGCSNFIISGCITKNMNDCHHSIDNSKDGIITNCVGKMSAGYIPDDGSKRSNFIEVQGENIIISNHVFDGGMESDRGIQITDHFQPSEVDGRASKNILIDNCIVRNVNKKGMKITGAHNTRVSNCIIDNTEIGISVDKNPNKKTCPNGVRLKNISILNTDTSFVLFGNNIYLGSGIGDNNGKTTFRENRAFLVSRSNNINFKSEIPWKELNPNPNLFLNSSNTRIHCFETGNFVTNYDKFDKPLGTTGSVVLDDDATTHLGAVIMDRRIECTNKEAIHVRLFAKKCAANSSFSLIFVEYKDNQFVKSNFVPSCTLTNEWQELYYQFSPTNSETNNIEIQISPATTWNDPSATGMVKIASFNISKDPIGKN